MAASTLVTIVFDVTVNGFTGDVVSNTAIIINPSGASAIATAPDVTISQTTKPAGVPTPITLFQSYAGDVNYVITGASHRTQSNSVNPCSATPGPVTATVPVLPPGSTIQAAYLYWVGSCSDAPSSTQTTPVYALSFNGVPVTAPASGRFAARFVGGGANLDYYGGRADVTALVNPVTTNYTVNGLLVNTGPPHCNFSAVVSGWSLVVVYENSVTERRRVLNIFDGFDFYQTATPPLVLNMSNFQVDAGPDGKVTAISWEGDPNLGGPETITFQSQSAGAPTTLFHPGVNPIGNQFNSTATSSLPPFGVLNPIPPQQYGIDIDTYDISALLIEDDLTATATYQSGQDLVIHSAEITLIANKAVADLSLTKTDNGQDFGRGECGDYLITVTNNGPDPEPGPITVTDTLPTGLTYNSDSGGDWSCSAVGQNVTCTYTGPQLSVGNNLTFTLTTNVSATAPGIIQNSAFVSGVAFDNISTNNATTETTDVVSGVELSTSTKTVVDLNGGDPTPGDVLRYTITISETGGSSANGIQVIDHIPEFVNNFLVISIPPGAINNSSGPTAGNFNNGLLDIQNISLLANSSVTIEFDVTINGTNGDVISNEALIFNQCLTTTALAPDVAILFSDLSTSLKTARDVNAGSAVLGDVIEYTITLIESAGAISTNVRVTDDIPEFVDNFTVISIPPGATNNSTGAGTGANGNGFLDIGNITVPAATASTTIVLEVEITGSPGNDITNVAQITNPSGLGGTAIAPTFTISSVPASGVKQLYLFDNTTFDPNGFNVGPQPYLSRTPPAAPQSNVIVDKNQPPVTWTLTPPTEGPITTIGNTIPVILWISKGGSNQPNSANRRLTITIDSVGTTSTIIGTLANQQILAPPSTNPNEFTFNIPIASPPATVLPGSQIRLTVQNTTPGGGSRRVRVFPIGTTTNSRIDLDASTVINVDSVQFYDAAFPGSAPQTLVNPGDTLFVRSVVSDPFGSFDIVGATIDIVDPNSITQVSAAAMTEVADSGALTKTYEFSYTIPATGPGGFWNAFVTAAEGTEGTVIHQGVGLIEVVSLLPDLLLIKTSQAIWDPHNLSVNPKAIPGGYVHYIVRLTNTGPGNVAIDTVVVTDPIPADTDLYVGDLGGSPANSPVIFANGTGPEASGLNLVFSGLSVNGDGVDFSNDPIPPYTYTYDPTATMDADGFDANVTSIRINPTGTMNGASGGNNPFFRVLFRVRVE